MAVMTIAGTWPDVWPHEDRPLTVADMERMPDDGNRYELDEGMLIASPVPFNNHQVVVMELAVALREACPPELIVLPGPGINFSEMQHRVPDVAVVLAAGFKTDYVFEARPPVLAVEVASRSTAHHDRTRKKAVYEQYGVQSYWIVTPDLAKPAIVSYELADGRFTEGGQASGDDLFEASRPFPG